jgi:2-polyprenyl-6-methoxyphenol hydroxylase-like FAD-dependent oxidoreductase
LEAVDVMADAEVIVVGGGPTGLAAAVSLAVLGRTAVVVDPAEDKGVGSKALTIHAGTLRALEQIGCVEPVLAEGLRVRGLRLRTRRSILLDQRLDRLPSKYAFAITLPQPQTEEILRQRAIELGVRFITGRAVDVTHDESGVMVILEVGTRLRGEYVVAADGKRSAIRQSVGIGFPSTGANRGDEELMALADVSLSGLVDLDHVSAFPGPRGLLLIMPLPSGRARIAANIQPGRSAETREDIQRLVDQRGPRGIRIDDIAWTSLFQFSHHLADTFRAGRVLLAGDAAHINSPVGGQGMNLGIRDALYLAHAIDRTLRTGDDGSLDAYAANRRHSAAQVVAVTNRMSRMLFAPRAAQPIRNAILRVVSHSPAAAKQGLTMSGLLDTGPSTDITEAAATTATL